MSDDEGGDVDSPMRLRGIGIDLSKVKLDVEATVFPKIRSSVTPPALEWPKIWCPDAAHAASVYADIICEGTSSRGMFVTRCKCNTGTPAVDGQFTDYLIRDRTTAYGEKGQALAIGGQKTKRLDDAVNEVDGCIMSWVRCKIVGGALLPLFGTAITVHDGDVTKQLVQYFKRVLCLVDVNAGREIMYEYLYYNKTVATEVIFVAVTAMLYVRVAPYLIRVIFSRRTPSGSTQEEEALRNTLEDIQKRRAAAERTRNTHSAENTEKAVHPIELTKEKLVQDVVDGGYSADMKELYSQVGETYDGITETSSYISDQTMSPEGVFDDYPDWVFTLCMATIAALRIIRNYTAAEIVQEITDKLVPCRSVLGHIFSRRDTAAADRPATRGIHGSNLHKIAAGLMRSNNAVGQTYRALLDDSAVITKASPNINPYVAIPEGASRYVQLSVHPFVKSVQSALVDSDTRTRQTRLDAYTDDRVVFLDPVRFYIQDNNDSDSGITELVQIKYRDILQTGYGIQVKQRPVAAPRTGLNAISNAITKLLAMSQRRTPATRFVCSALSGDPADNREPTPPEVYIHAKTGTQYPHLHVVVALLKSDYPAPGCERTLISLCNTIKKNTEASKVAELDIDDDDRRDELISALVYAAYTEKPSARSYYISPRVDIVLSRVTIRHDRKPGTDPAHVVAKTLLYSTDMGSSERRDVEVWSSHTLASKGNYTTINTPDTLPVLVFIGDRILQVKDTAMSDMIAKTVGVASGTRPDDNALARHAYAVVRSTPEYAVFLRAHCCDESAINVDVTIDRVDYFDYVLVYFKFSGKVVPNFRAAVFAHKSSARTGEDHAAHPKKDANSGAGGDSAAERAPKDDSEGSEDARAEGTEPAASQKTITDAGDGHDDVFTVDAEPIILPNALVSDGKIVWPRIWCRDEQHAASLYADYLFGHTLLRSKYPLKPVCRTGDTEYDNKFKLGALRHSGKGYYKGDDQTKDTKIGMRHKMTVVGARLDAYIRERALNEHLTPLFVKYVALNSEYTPEEARDVLTTRLQDYFRRVLRIRSNKEDDTERDGMYTYLFHNEYVANEVIFKVISAALYAKVGPFLLYIHLTDENVERAVCNDLINKTTRGPIDAPIMRLTVDSTVGIEFLPREVKTLRPYRVDAFGGTTVGGTMQALVDKLKPQVRDIYKALGDIAHLFERQLLTGDSADAPKYTRDQMFKEYPDWVFAFSMLVVFSLRIIGDIQGVAAAKAITDRILACTGILGKLFSTPSRIQTGQPTFAVIDNPNAIRLLHCVLGGEKSDETPMSLADCNRFMTQSAPWVHNFEVADTNAERKWKIHPFVLGIQATLVGTEKGPRYMRLGASVAQKYTFRNPVSLEPMQSNDIEELAYVKHHALLRKKYNINIAYNHADPVPTERTMITQAIVGRLNVMETRVRRCKRLQASLEGGLGLHVDLYNKPPEMAALVASSASPPPPLAGDAGPPTSAHLTETCPRTIAVLAACIERDSVAKEIVAGADLGPSANPAAKQVDPDTQLLPVIVFASDRVRSAERSYYITPEKDLLISSVRIRREDTKTKYVKASVLVLSSRNNGKFLQTLLWSSITTKENDAYKTARRVTSATGAQVPNTLVFVADSAWAVTSPEDVISTVGARCHGPPDNSALTAHAVGLVRSTAPFRLFITANGLSGENVDTEVRIDRGDYFDYAFVYFRFFGPTVANFCAAVFVSAEVSDEAQ